MSANTTPARIVDPSHADWETVRPAWNLAAYQHPTAIALPESADDVIAAVNYARENGLRVAPQSTGHGANALSAGEGTLLVKLDQMRGVEIDADAKVARVQGGAQWQDVNAAAAEHGLAGLLGSAGDVGVSGYLVGGGYSWFGRKYGLACNNVRAIEVVTADGELVRTDGQSNADLFWAVRGGGGSFGVITAIELDLFPITEAFAGMMLWPIERDREVLSTWREWVETVPDEVTSIGRLLHFPPIPDIPEPFRGREFVGVEATCLLSEAEGTELIAPLRALGPEMDSFATVPVAALEHLHMDPPGPVPGVGQGLVLTDLTPDGLDAIATTTGAGSGSPLLSFEMRHAGGAFGREGSECGSVAAIQGKFVTFGVGIAPVPPAAQAVQAGLDATLGALEPWRAPRQLLGFRESATPAEDLYGDSLGRLQQIKSQVDPDNLFQANHPL